MESKKTVKIITKIDDSPTSASLKNISGSTTFKSLNQLTQILVSNSKDSAGLYYLDKEIEINEEEATIDQIFSDLNDIEIEVRLKKSTASKEDANSNINMNINPIKNIFSNCLKHPKEYSKYYCETCKQAICFRCTLLNSHKTHQIFEKYSFYGKKFNSLNEKHENIARTLQTDPCCQITSLNILKNEQIEKIETDFDQIIKKIMEVKNFYIEFFTDYFNFIDKKIVTIQSGYQQMHEELINLQNKFSMQNEFYYQNLDKIKIIEKQTNKFLTTFKDFSDFNNYRKEFSHDYDNNVNTLLHKLEVIKLEYFNDKKLKRYDDYTNAENDMLLLDKYLEEFTENYKNEHTYHHILTLPIPLTKKVLTYNFNKSEFGTVTVGEKNYNFKFFDYSRYINSGEYIFVSGGLENDKELNNCYLISMKDRKVLQCATMNQPRSQHSLVFTSFKGTSIKLIFAISGYKNKNIEIYNPSKNSWCEFKALSTSRCNANVLFVDNHYYMYVFGGSDEERYLTNSFEKINFQEFVKIYETYVKNNLSFENYKFSFEKGTFIIPSNMNSLINLNYSGFGIIPLNSEHFLICGGFNSESDLQTTDEVRVFEYDKKTQSFKITNKLENGQEVDTLAIISCFYSQEFLRIKENLLAQFNAGGNLIKFNPETMEFDTLINNINI